MGTLKRQCIHFGHTPEVPGEYNSAMMLAEQITVGERNNWGASEKNLLTFSFSDELEVLSKLWTVSN